MQTATITYQRASACVREHLPLPSGGARAPHAALFLSAIILCIVTSCGMPPSATPSLAPTSGILVPATLPTPSLQPTPTKIDIALSEECISIVKEMPLPKDSALVLQEFPLQSDIYLIDLRDLQTRRIGYAYVPLAASPDGKRLAFIEPGEGLVLADAFGNRQLTLPVLFEWNGVIAWDAGERILIEDMPYHSGYIDPPATTLVLDLVTHERQTAPLPPEFRRAWGSLKYLPWDNFAMVGAAYDLSLSRVALWWDDPSTASPDLTLLNLADNSVLARLSGYSSEFGNGPHWTSNGSRFFVTAPTRSPPEPGHVGLGQPINVDPTIPSLGGNEIFSVSRNGTITRHSFLTTQFKAGEYSIAVSPQGMQLAFWLDRDLSYHYSRTHEVSLALLDVHSGTVTDLCLPSIGTPPSTIVWSPDGKFLAVQQQDQHARTSQVLIVDLLEHVAMPLTAKEGLAAWMLR